ncbi:MAG: pyridoxal phosphate-dependent aminotransferase [Halobacteriales archaeon]|nr:pyridoxal phosphate-dependent aminotransferase [Halobacteriales archaeon]
MESGQSRPANRFSERVAGIEQSATIRFGNIARELQADGVDVVSMAGGSPDFQTPDHIREAAIDAIERDENQLTTTQGLPALRDAIAEKLRTENDIPTDADQIVVTPGSKYALFQAIFTLLQPGDEVALLDPAWVTYEAIATVAGGTINRIGLDPETGFSPGSVDLTEAITDETRLIVVNNPSNPAGAVFSRGELATIRDLAVDHGCWVIADEIYERLVHEGEHISIGALDGMADRTVTVNGFSKAYAMSGWRLGYFSAPTPLVEQVRKLQSNTVSCPTTLVQHAGVAALRGPQAVVEEMRRTYEDRVELVIDALADAGIDIPKPAAAFYVFVPVGEDDLTLCEELLREEHVGTVPGSAFGVPGYIRLALATDADAIETGINRIAPYLGA